MNIWTIILAVIIILFIVTLLFISTESKRYNFYNVDDIFPELRTIHFHRNAIMSELTTVLNDPKNWEYWPEKDHYNGPPGSDWKIFPFYADFQHNTGVCAEDNCKKMPVLSSFIKSLPNLKLATISKLSPGMKLKPHRGWGNHSNNVLRCHYGLIVPTLPNGKSCCYIDVNGQKQYHKEDDWMVFDDSEMHMAENQSDKDRVVLIIDIIRPTTYKGNPLPIGTSNVGDTKELMDIVKYFKQRQLTRD